ncbi:MAG: hypothetical protein FD126_3622, partial [Elusimicrobia bacterium]
LQRFGKDVIGKHGEFLAGSIALEDGVCLIHTNANYLPTRSKVGTAAPNGDWEPGLYGYLLQSGRNARVVNWELEGEAALRSCEVAVLQDLGNEPSADLPQALERLAARGGQVVAFMDHALARGAGFRFEATTSTGPAATAFTWAGGGEFSQDKPEFLSRYALADERCESVLSAAGASAGFRCRWGRGRFTQIGAPIYKEFNSAQYAHLGDIRQRDALWRELGWSKAPRVAVAPMTPKVIAPKLTWNGAI